jgi:hypothetical protein
VVLVSAEPLAYRTTIAAALRLLRPEVEVVEAELSDRDEVIARLRPALVLCSCPAPADGAAIWVELYPDGADRTLVSEGGRRRWVEHPTLADLVALLDRAALPVS